MFFALSGFLVAASLERCRTLLKFLSLRAIRIFPALMVEVIISAFLLGPLVTGVSLSEYFTDPLFFHYLWNLVGHPQFFLPGVFLDNPVPRVVNGQLWTVPFELLCYISLAGLTVLGIKRYPIIAPTGSIGLLGAWIGLKVVMHGELAAMPGRVSGAILISCFLAGIAVYFYRMRIAWRPVWGTAALVASLGLLWSAYGEYVAVFPIAYLTVFIGVANPRKILFLKNADYSYGIFIYGFVIQQAVAFWLPGSREWYLNVLISVPAALCLAALSWHFVEKPASELRKYVDWLEEKYLGFGRSIVVFARGSAR
jgi:peptidoglycan/LPS O-acetylase OafA/YrhL